MVVKDLPKISLKALKVFLKTYEANSPAMVELKEDLGKVVTALQDGNSDSLVECNSYIAGKYFISPNIAFRYNLRCTTESELRTAGLVSQTMALHQIGHLLEDALKHETVLTKVSTALNETAKEVVAYGIEKLMENGKATQ
ncbi:MAG: hypothetical protein J6J26_06595 [Bacteroides sp.]|nr:hypothetical protein [Bacteroides sp.]